MRWAYIGPSLTFQLGGGDGGISGFLDHLAGPMQSWWNDHGLPDLTPDVRQAIAAGVTEYVAGTQTHELAVARDRFLVDLLTVLKSHRSQLAVRDEHSPVSV